MNFDGTIIITDPCYIAKSGDWNDKTKFVFDDWGMRKILVPEITQYLWKETGVGDGSWEILGLNNITNRVESEKFVARIEKAMKNFKPQDIQSKVDLEEVFKEQHHIGRFSVDSGSFGVFYLDEVLKYNPDFLRGHGIWLYTIIENFIGDISLYYYPKDSNNFHLLGLGNTTFISI